MTNTNHTHTTQLLMMQDDVAIDRVLNVAAGAIEPLCGRPDMRIISTVEHGNHRLIEVDAHYFAANDNEAARMAQVLRSAILPLVHGCTIGVTRPRRRTAGV